MVVQLAPCPVLPRGRGSKEMAGNYKWDCRRNGRSGDKGTNRKIVESFIIDSTGKVYDKMESASFEDLILNI